MGDGADADTAVRLALDDPFTGLIVHENPLEDLLVADQAARSGPGSSSSGRRLALFTT